jgi:hypothetical protein
MQRYYCHRSIFPHKIYFGEYYSIVRKYPVVVWVEGHFIQNFTFQYAIILSKSVLRSSSGEKASLMLHL